MDRSGAEGMQAESSAITNELGDSKTILAGWGLFNIPTKRSAGLPSVSYPNLGRYPKLFRLQNRDQVCCRAIATYLRLSWTELQAVFNRETGLNSPFG
jgi:hypothetical protein